jgi:hypothetical protein
MPVRITDTSVSRRLRLAILPVASRSLSLWRRSCQTRSRRAKNVLERATSQASPKRAAMTTTRPQGAESGVCVLRRSMSESNMAVRRREVVAHRIGAVPTLTSPGRRVLTRP